MVRDNPKSATRLMVSGYSDGAFYTICLWILHMCMSYSCGLNNYLGTRMNLVIKCSIAKMTCCRIARISTIVDHVSTDVQFPGNLHSSLGNRDSYVLTPMSTAHNMNTCKSYECIARAQNERIQLRAGDD
jgi:hypothetical protein